MAMGTQLTGGRVLGAVRIDSACWIDGNDNHLIIEFWYLSGSFLRTEYNRRTTRSKSEFVPVRSDAFVRMQRLLDGQLSDYQI